MRRRINMPALCAGMRASLASEPIGDNGAINRLADMRRAIDALERGEVSPRFIRLPTGQLGLDLYMEAVRPGEAVPPGAIGVRHAAGCARWLFRPCNCAPEVVRTC